MKKYRYVVAATCLLLSAAGFIGLYATNQTEEKKELADYYITHYDEVK